MHVYVIFSSTMSCERFLSSVGLSSHACKSIDWPGGAWIECHTHRSTAPIYSGPATTFESTGILVWLVNGSAREGYSFRTLETPSRGLWGGERVLLIALHSWTPLCSLRGRSSKLFRDGENEFRLLFGGIPSQRSRPTRWNLAGDGDGG